MLQNTCKRRVGAQLSLPAVTLSRYYASASTPDAQHQEHHSPLDANVVLKKKKSPTNALQNQQDESSTMDLEPRLSHVSRARATHKPRRPLNRPAPEEGQGDRLNPRTDIQKLREHLISSKVGRNPTGTSSKASKSLLALDSLEDSSDVSTSRSDISELVREHWVQEQWKDNLEPSTRRREKPREDRKGKHREMAPHIIRSDREVAGILEPMEDDILQDVKQSLPRPPISQLAHGLDRVLFNPGVHWVQDPRSRVYNFTPWLESVPKVSDFDYTRIPGFVPSSKDKELATLAKREGKKFRGSTSSLSGVLSQCYFLISETKEVNTSRLSEAFRNQPRTFSPGQRWPASVILEYNDGHYAVNSDKSKTDFPEKTILTWLGTMLERFLTLDPEKFGRLLKSAPPLTPKEESANEREAYRYAKSNNFLMRSQLDCFDPRLPGDGVFDVKTRACVATRLDILNYEEHAGYTIRTQHGIIESFEKEYYDLIRSAFLKYSFQVRIGGMDGVIVAYHNTDRLFGFQYIPISEMDECLYGSSEGGVGDRVFEKCVGLMEKAMEEVTTCFGGNQSLKATFETKEDTKGMHIWVEPAEWNGPEAERPIEQLRVEVTSYLGEDPVKGLRAATSGEADWTMHYKIQKLVLPHKVKRANLDSARARQNPAFLIPTGIEPSKLEEFWTTLDHSGKIPEGKYAFDPSMFVEPPQGIQRLRELSRKGKEETDKISELYEGEPKVIWGAEPEFQGDKI
ncbi:Pet127-domain-containing protein [Coprinopsis marcescibilis]|uniref:Pet127-domain-containing protein n=1 Tax=Coprinopsis marcescibilis TaxID=230819 RepID=A0A5C3L4R0_COPMA|nr:Pet127-domain-containing protein [Coprinopsis marcescibilis]